MEAVTKKFYCTLCSAAFTRQDHLKRHAHTVHSFRPGLSCPNCEAHFTHGDDLLKHVSEGHRSENFTCKECSAQYNCYQKYSEHAATHSLLNPVNTCPHCSSVYKRRDHMLRHIKSKHLNQVFTCPICTQDYKRKDHMVRHVREKHHVYNHVEAFSVENRMEADTEKFYCTLCSATFTRQDHLKRHAHSVHSHRPGSSCPNCQAHFTHGDELQKHISEAHTTENFTCKECSAHYNCYQKYSEHAATHSLLDPANTCPHCSSVYKRRDHMLRHIKSKHLNQVFTCPICTQDYKRKDHMVRHVREKHHVYNHVEAFGVENRMEADTEKFYCTLCSATFTRQDHLKRHAHSVHSHRPGSSCPNCQAHFTHGDELQKHISEAHTTENFTCKECSAHYNCYQKYSEHAATHSLLDPANTCPHCSSVYKRRDHMLRHIKSKHLNQVFTCPICTQDYKRKDHMVRHVREKHHVYNHVEAFGVENR